MSLDAFSHCSLLIHLLIISSIAKLAFSPYRHAPSEKKDRWRDKERNNEGEEIEEDERIRDKLEVKEQIGKHGERTGRRRGEKSYLSVSSRPSETNKRADRDSRDTLRVSALPLTEKETEGERERYIEREKERGTVSGRKRRGRWNLTEEKIDFLGWDLGVIGKGRWGEGWCL